jgi:hypothetical protein
MIATLTRSSERFYSENDSLKDIQNDSDTVTSYLYLVSNARGIFAQPHAYRWERTVEKICHIDESRRDFNDGQPAEIGDNFSCVWLRVLCVPPVLPDVLLRLDIYDVSILPQQEFRQSRVCWFQVHAPKFLISVAALPPLPLLRLRVSTLIYLHMYQ